MADALHHPEGQESPSPSGWRRRALIAVIALAGGTISGYMGMYQIGQVKQVWDPVFGNQSKQVLDSRVSETIRSWVRIPDAFLGALVFFADVAVAALGSQDRWHRRPWLVVLFAAVIAPGVVISLFLVVMQATVVNAWCFLCLLTAVTSVTLAALAYTEVRATVRHLVNVWSGDPTLRTIWGALWGSHGAH